TPCMRRRRRYGICEGCSTLLRCSGDHNARYGLRAQTPQANAMLGLLTWSAASEKELHDDRRGVGGVPTRWKQALLACQSPLHHPCSDAQELTTRRVRGGPLKP